MVKRDGQLEKIPAKHKKPIEAQLRLIAETIQTRRKQKGLTQEELAEMVDLTVVALGYIEQGRRYPSLPNLLFIFRVLEIPISFSESLNFKRP